MRILVTGANGYLGQGIVKAILDMGHQVIAADFKTDNIDLQNMIKKFNAKIKQEVLISEIKNDLDKCDIAKDIEVGDGFVTVKLSK